MQWRRIGRNEANGRQEYEGEGWTVFREAEGKNWFVFGQGQSSVPCGCFAGLEQAQGVVDAVLREKRAQEGIAELEARMIRRLGRENLLGLAEWLLNDLHEYETLCREGSSRSERQVGRAVVDQLAYVCCELGIRVLSEVFESAIREYKAGYEACLKEAKGAKEVRGDEREGGRLGWWNL